MGDSRLSPVGVLAISIQFVEPTGRKGVMLGRCAPTPGQIRRTIEIPGHVVTLVGEVRRLCVLGVASHLDAGEDPADGWGPIEERLPGEWDRAVRRLRRAAARLARRYDRAADWWVPPTLPQDDLTRGASSVVEAVLREAALLLAHVDAVGEDAELAMLHARSTFSWPDDEGDVAQAALRVECRQLLDAARRGALEPVPRRPGRPSEGIAGVTARQAQAAHPPGWDALDHPARVAVLYRAIPEADQPPPARPDTPAIELPPVGSQAIRATVLGEPRPVKSLAMLKALRLLRENFPHPVLLRALSNVHSNAHRALRKLVESDPMWDLALSLPAGRRGEGYRVRSVAEATRRRPRVQP